MGALDRIFRRRQDSQRPLESYVKGLFAAGEQGVWYDPAGHADVLNQLGPELLASGGFDSATGWLVINGGWSIAGGKASVNNSSGSTSRLNSNLYPPVRRWYIATVVVTSMTGGAITVVNGGGTAAITKAGTYALPYYRSENFGFYLDALTGTVAEVESVSIREWIGASNCALFQDPAGTTPAYLPGQGQVDPPVGLLLDKRRSRGGELFSDGAVVFSAPSARVSPGVYRVYSAAGEYSMVNFRPAGAVIGGWYELTFTVDSIAVAGAGMVLEGTSALSNAVVFNTVGKKTLIVQTTANYIGIKRAANAIDYQISGVSIRELPGNHAYQATATSRPTLSARYNGLLASEKYNEGSYWAWQASFTSEITADTVAPDNTTTAWKITSTNANAALSKAGLTGFRNPVLTVWCKAGTWNPTIMVRNATTATNLIAGTITAPDRIDTYGKFTNTDMGNGWRRLRVEVTSGVATTDTIVVYVGSTGAIPVGQFMYIWRSDLREAGDGVGVPEYQRVADASTYDTQGFPLYLRFDGVDDWLQTANVDFSGVTAVLTMAAVRKLSDANRGIIVELGASGYGQPGSFNIEMVWFSPNWSSSYSGSAGNSTVVEPNIAAPASAVVGSYADQGAPSIRLLYQGQARAPSTAAVGGGGFMNAPVYIGRRGGSSSAANMRLYGLIIRGGATPGATISRVDRHLNQKSRIY